MNVMLFVIILLLLIPFLIQEFWIIMSDGAVLPIFCRIKKKKLVKKSLIALKSPKETQVRRAQSLLINLNVSLCERKWREKWIIYIRSIRIGINWNRQKQWRTKRRDVKWANISSVINIHKINWIEFHEEKTQSYSK